MPITMEVKGQAWPSGLSGREMRKDMDKIPGQAREGQGRAGQGEDQAFVKWCAETLRETRI